MNAGRGVAVTAFIFIAAAATLLDAQSSPPTPLRRGRGRRIAKRVTGAVRGAAAR